MHAPPQLLTPPHKLRGPAAILFISRDTFSDSIAKLFRACFPGVSHKYRAICCKMGYRTDMSVYNKAPRRGIAPCWGIAGTAEKVSRDRGYRSDTIAVSRDMGPLSSQKPPFGNPWKRGPRTARIPAARSLGVPKPGCFKPGCLQVWRGGALLHPFVPFCALLRTCVCALLRSFACFCHRNPASNRV